MNHILKFIIIINVFLFTSCQENSPEFINSMFFGNEEVKVNDETTKDIDGNIYHTVTIGEQTWMVENLKTTHYSDGTPIKESLAPNSTDANIEQYGRLYTNAVAMRNDSTEGVQGVCPEGWHIPSREEIQELITYAGKKNQYIDFANQLCSTTGWKVKNGKNLMKYNAMPNGGKLDGQFRGFSEVASFWTSSQTESKKGILYFMVIDSANYRRNFYYDDNTPDYLGVRCIKNTSEKKLPTVIVDSVTTRTNRPILHAHVSDQGIGTITRVGICYGSNKNPELTDIVIKGEYKGDGTFSCILNLLTTNSTYYIRAFATNELGTGYSKESTYKTTAFAPELSDISMTALTSTTASFNSTVTSDGGNAVTAKGVCWSLTQNPTITGSKTSDGAGSGAYTSNVTGLTANTTYYVRSYATNGIGTAYNKQVLFITLPGINIGSATAITYKSATITATLPSQGSNPITEYGICWSTSSTPTIDMNKVQGSNLANSSFSCPLSGLNPNTKYYARAYATNSSGTNYSTEISFTTASVITPVLSINPATSITFNSASITGHISTQGDMPITEYGFCWSTTNTTPTTSNSKTSVSNLSNGIFSSSLFTLAQSTKYYIRSYATTAYGTYYSPVGNFTTPADPFTVSDGLLAFYKFDGQDAKDALGTYNGVISGGVSFSSTTPNSSGYAAQFDGSTGYINIPYQILPASGSWSISMWLKSNKTTYNGLFRLSGSYNYGWITQSSTLNINPNTGAVLGYSMNLSTTLLNNSWHLLTITYDGSYARYYIDGTFYENIASSNTAWGNTSFTRIGYGLLYYYNGLFDNFRFYKKALSTNEITALYNAKQ